MSESIYQAESNFATELATTIAKTKHGISLHPKDPQKILLKKEDGKFASFDLTPVHAKLQPATAYPYFNGITEIEDLITAYNQARQNSNFEDELSNTHVHSYAKEYLDHILQYARENLNSEDVTFIANWVKNFDIYVAVKCIESLLNNKSDLAIFSLAKNYNWNIHFDHLAIRCGSAIQLHAESVVELLTKHHGYIASQVESEQFYQFEDGWNAYLLYKMLDNGQVLRLFIDQSDSDASQQIIQHWNFIYGFTAHHLAIRATKFTKGYRVAIPLNIIVETLKKNNIQVMTPTGNYTHGLLEQVFTRPEVNKSIPTDLIKELSKHGDDLEETIKNAKLLELVSRCEMNLDFSKKYYRLYGLEFNLESPLHSAPIYNYFLPAQAAHVINTSLNVFQ